MSRKLKALCLSLFAVMALGGFAVMNASAETGGHFTSEVAATTITGSENSTHFTELTVPGLTGIRCTTASYSGTTSATTVTQITITPSYANCETTGGTPGEVTVDVNGCAYIFTIGKKSTADNTVDLECNGAKPYIAVTHQGCEIRVPAQNNIVGVAYNTTVENNKHAITLTATASGFTTNFEAGFCVLLGTSHTSTLSGSVTVTGKNTATGAAVGITATGSEG